MTLSVGDSIVIFSTEKGLRRICWAKSASWALASGSTRSPAWTLKPLWTQERSERARSVKGVKPQRGQTITFHFAALHFGCFMKKNVKLWFDPLSALGESREANLLTNSGSATGSNANCLNGCHDRAHRDQWLNVLCPDVTPMPYFILFEECKALDHMHNKVVTTPLVQ